MQEQTLVEFGESRTLSELVKESEDVDDTGESGEGSEAMSQLVGELEVFFLERVGAKANSKGVEDGLGIGVRDDDVFGLIIEDLDRV